MSTKINRTILFTLASVCGLLGCRSGPIEDKAPPVTQLGVDSSQAGLLETGREIYTGKCTKCHRAKSVQDFTAEAWSSRILPKMAKKAKLTTTEADALLAYVMAVQATKSDLSLR